MGPSTPDSNDPTQESTSFSERLLLQSLAFWPHRIKWAFLSLCDQTKQ